MTVRKGYYELCGILPDGSGRSSFYLSSERIKEIQRKGPAWKFENARLLEEALKSPVTIFEGLKREGMNEAIVMRQNLLSVTEKEVPSKHLSLQIGFL